MFREFRRKDVGCGKKKFGHESLCVASSWDDTEDEDVPIEEEVPKKAPAKKKVGTTTEPNRATVGRPRKKAQAAAKQASPTPEAEEMMLRRMRWLSISLILRKGPRTRRQWFVNLMKSVVRHWRLKC